MGVEIGASGIKCWTLLIEPRASKSGLRLSASDPDASRVSTRAGITIRSGINLVALGEYIHPRDPREFVPPMSAKVGGLGYCIKANRLRNNI